MNHNWGSLHATFLSNLFSLFNDYNIKYFVLRNFELLPEDNIGTDVDIVIEPGKYKIVSNLIKDEMKSCEIVFYQVVQFDRMRCWYIMDYKLNFSIHLDIIENEVYKGFEFYSFAELYNNTVKYKNFYVLNREYDILLLLVQNLVAYKSLKEQYRKKVQLIYPKIKNRIDNNLKSFWGEKLGYRIIKDLETNNFDNIISYSKDLEKAALKRIFQQKTLKTIKNISRFLLGKFYRIIICPRKFWRFIAVEAPDGTGKTTFIDALIEKMQFYYNSPKSRFCVHHFRPEMLPNLGAVGEKAGIAKQDKDFTNPHRAKTAGKISSLLRMTYYWFDYILGVPYFLRKEVQYGHYTIFDRYIYDFLIDPKRSRINLPYSLRKLYSKFVIEPQIVFVLYADTDVIYKRKQELTKEEIERQLLEFKKLEKEGERFVFINANRSVNEMVSEASRLILEKFMDRV